MILLDATLVFQCIENSCVIILRFLLPSVDEKGADDTFLVRSERTRPAIKLHEFLNSLLNLLEFPVGLIFPRPEEF